MPEEKSEPSTSQHPHAEESVAGLATEDANFFHRWTSAYFYAQDNLPPAGSETLDRLHKEYLRRVHEIIQRAETGQHWQQLARSAVEAINLAEWLYPFAPRESDDELLVWFATHGHPVGRAREIVNQIRERRRHRPPSPKVRQESIIAYDLHRSGKHAAFIADKICSCGESKHGRNCIEKVRQRVRQVAKLLGD